MPFSCSLFCLIQSTRFSNSLQDIVCILLSNDSSCTFLEKRLTAMDNSAIGKACLTQNTLNNINSWNFEKNFNSKKLIVKISESCMSNNKICVYIVKSYNMNFIQNNSSIYWQAFTSDGILNHNPIFFNRPNWNEAFLLMTEKENTLFYQIKEFYNSTFLNDFKKYHTIMSLGESVLKLN